VAESYCFPPGAIQYQVRAQNRRGRTACDTTGPRRLNLQPHLLSRGRGKACEFAAHQSAVRHLPCADNGRRPPSAGPGRDQNNWRRRLRLCGCEYLRIHNRAEQNDTASAVSLFQRFRAMPGPAHAGWFRWTIWQRGSADLGKRRVEFVITRPGLPAL
jgi:hypothetical protein